MKAKNYSIKPFELMFSIYVGMGPIYWIPWVNLNMLNVFKFTLFVFIIIFPLFQKITFRSFQFPGGKNIFLLFAIFFFLSLPGLVVGDLNFSIYKLQNEVQILFFIYACGFLIKREKIKYVAYLSVRIFICLGIISLLLMLIVPGYVSPLNSELTLSQTGLGGSRTGWSPSIALFIPWLYAGSGVLSGYMIWVAVIAMLGNQVLVAGRTGMIAAILPLLFYGLFRKNIKIFLMVLVFLLIILLFAFNNLELLRLGVGGFSSRSDLDDLSTGRIEVYIDALKIIYENPFVGIGPGFAEFGAVHNVILRAAVEGGIPYALSLVALISVALYRGWKGMGNKNWFVVSAFLTVLSGVVSSMFEPVGMLGSFNNSSFWWFCFAICVSTGYSERMHDFKG